MEKAARISRKEAVPMDRLIEQYIREMKLAAGLNTQRIFAAWDAVSNASAYTLKRFFRDGTLYITLSSSVFRRELSFRKEMLVEQINAWLEKDILFVKDDPKVGKVQQIILK